MILDTRISFIPKSFQRCDVLPGIEGVIPGRDQDAQNSTQYGYPISYSKIGI